MNCSLILTTPPLFKTSDCNHKYVFGLFCASVTLKAKCETVAGLPIVANVGCNSPGLIVKLEISVVSVLYKYNNVFPPKFPI